MHKANTAYIRRMTILTGVKKPLKYVAYYGKIDIELPIRVHSKPKVVLHESGPKSSPYKVSSGLSIEVGIHEQSKLSLSTQIKIHFGSHINSSDF